MMVNNDGEVVCFFGRTGLIKNGIWVNLGVGSLILA
jgi:hypothetical protein